MIDQKLRLVEAGSFEVSIVVYPEVDREKGTIAWIAQCLEYDVCEPRQDR